jgi:hypothetical protein
MQEEGSLTFGDRKVRNRLPSIHRHPPSTLNAATAEVNDKLVSVAVERG